MLLRSLKHCIINVFVEELQNFNFSNYERFSCIAAARTDFLNKLIKLSMKLLQAKILKLKIMLKNGLIEKFLS